MDRPKHSDQRGGHRPAVSLSDVAFSWADGRGFSLHIEAFEIERGETVLLLGPSGSGKSTLLSLLCGIATPQAGRIDVLGTDMAALSAMQRDRFRAEHLGIVFQMFNLLPYGSLIDNVTLPLNFAPRRRQRASAEGDAAAEAVRLLERLGIGRHDALAARASAISVGQQQRVAVARALIGKPEIVIADEPTSALDVARRDDFLRLVFEEVRAVDATLVMVSHDHGLAERFDRVIALSDIIVRAGGVL
ncbi:MAG: ABC transporter ATP-binding protein [Pseudomonadota bacterium]